MVAQPAASPLVARKASIRVNELGKRFATDGFNLLSDLQRDYGDLVQIAVIPGILNQWMIFTPELAYEILVTHPERFKKPELGKRLFRESFGNGLFFSEGDFWKRQRKLAQPAFHHVRINAYAEQMVAQTQSFITNWKHESVIDLDAAMHALTLSIVVNALFKTDISGETERIGAAMAALGSASAQQVTSIVQTFMPAWLPTEINRKKHAAVMNINQTIYRLIAEHRIRPADKGDLLSMFMAAKDEDTGESMSDAQIRDELMTMFIAGHETSAITLTWALIELSRHPEITTRLQAELDSVLAVRAPTLADLPMLPTVTQVIKETLRLYPPTLFISRQSHQPMPLGGKTVGKNDLLTLVIAQIQRDPRYFDDPLEFRPERFVGDFERSLPKGVYMPFGAGPRICIGNGFALLEMQLVLATLMQRFTFTLADESEVIKSTFGITLGFASSPRIRIAHRAATPLYAELL